MRTSLIIIVALLLAGGTGCGGGAGEGAPGDDRIRVVATTMPVADFARQVGGDRVEVTGLLDPGAEPHDYEPTPSDAEAVAEADLVVSNGAGLDDWLGDLLEQAGADAPRVEAAKGVTLMPTEEKGLSGDPHVWHDPAAAARMVDNIAAGLARADPPGAGAYRRSADAYKQRLARMATEIRFGLAAVPARRRDLVTTHDALGYFARAYDVNVVGSVLPATGSEAEPSARQVRGLVEAMRVEEARTIFTEKGAEARLEQRVAQEAGAAVSASLYADALGARGSGAEGHIEAELANARAMRSAWTAR